MKKILLSLSLLTVTVFGSAQSVSVNAKGDDVRVVIHDLFTQAKQNYVLAPGVRFVLFLSLNEKPFAEALRLVCDNANLGFEERGGVYFIDKSKPAKTVLIAPVAAERTPILESAASQPIRISPTTTKPKSEDQIISTKLKTNLKKVELKALCQEFSRQAGVQIILDSAIPAYKMDAVLNGVSLKFALDELCRAARLNWSFTNSGQILITKTGSASKSG